MKQILKILLWLISGILRGLFDLLFNLFIKKDHTYNASFGNISEHLNVFNHGFSVTGTKSLNKARSHTNVLLLGPTGSGKSSVVIISSAFSLARSRSTMIINDVSGEIYEKTSGYLYSKGYRILKCDFSDSKNSETFNPLDTCKSISDIQKVALLVVRNSIGESQGDNIFWEQSCIQLISLFARLLVFHYDPKYRTLQNVLRLIERFSIDGELIDKLFVTTGDEDLLSSYKATVVISDKTLQSVIATARTALTLFSDPEVCRTTSANSIDFSLLRREPTALYINNPLKDLMYFKPLSALFFQSLFNSVLSRVPARSERSIFFIMDEAATMKFPGLSTTISNIRKYNAGILLCLQDQMALISQYGHAEAHQIATNCGCHIFLPSQPLHTCKELSQILGKYTYVDDKNGNEKARELLTADEIRISEKTIILIGNSLPLLSKTVPYYRNIWIRGYTQIPPYQLRSTIPTNPPLIKFD